MHLSTETSEEGCMIVRWRLRLLAKTPPFKKGISSKRKVKALCYSAYFAYAFSYHLLLRYQAANKLRNIKK